MSLFDSASLIVTPNGVKEDKLYSIKPTDGSGDLVVTRATTATRVNSDGLIEQVPYNFLVNSENFSTWVLEGGTMTSGQTDPLGGNTAYKYVQASGGLWSNIVLDSNQTKVTYSFWAKSVYGGNLNMVLADGGGYNNYGTITINGTWTYYTFTLNRTYPSSGGMYLYEIDNSQGFYIWHPQINVGTSAKEYFPTTNRLDVPRLDYTNSSCPSILVEPQRTNLFTYSQQFDNAAWAKDNLTITANQSTSPEGITNAYLIDEGIASSTQHWIYQSPSLSNSTSYSISFYAKYISRKYIAVNIYNGSTSQYVTYNIQNGTIYGSTGDVTASITSVGNGWYRIVYTRTMSASGSPNFRIALADDSANVTYTGTNKQVYLYGAQLEAGSYATSYIPTVASTVTRNADVISKTGLSGITSITETFENGTTNVISGSPTSYTMSQGRIKHVIGI